MTCSSRSISIDPSEADVNDVNRFWVDAGARWEEEEASVEGVSALELPSKVAVAVAAAASAWRSFRRLIRLRDRSSAIVFSEGLMSLC